MQWGLLAAPDQLELQVGDHRYRIESRQRAGNAYFPLKKLAPILELELLANGGLMTVRGSRGALRLVAERPLVRFEGDYILLSAPVWRGDGDEWLVTEDFLSKALPLIAARRLDKLSDGRYRVHAAADNQVVVRVANYLDHVRIVFQPSRNSDVQVREVGSHIAVEFEDYVVQPRLPSVLPDSRFVAGIDFDSTRAYGAFRIQKGQGYRSFREFSLTEPDRRVVDVYGTDRISDSGPVAGVTVPAPIPPGVARSPLTDLVPGFRPPDAHSGAVIAIDPGHGGEDYGIVSEDGDLEKTLTLLLAGRVADLVSAAGFRTILTRTRDVELGIEQRSSVGNYYQSQAYLSLHVGGSASPASGGAVVYLHRYVEAAEGGPGTTLSPEDTSSEQAVPLVSWDDGQRSHLESSRELARRLQRDLNLLWGTNNKIVEVPLAVLAPVMAPAVMIETGFLTNPANRERLVSWDFQQRISQTIASTVVQFLSDGKELGSVTGRDLE